MAKILTVTKEVVITDGGETVVDAQTDHTREVDEYARSSATILNGSDITLCVQGTDTTGITDPFVLPLSNITGYSIESDAQLDIKEDAAAAAVVGGPGEFGKDQCSLSTLGLANSSGLTAHITFVVWGER